MREYWLDEKDIFKGIIINRSTFYSLKIGRGYKKYAYVMTEIF